MQETGDFFEDTIKQIVEIGVCLQIVWISIKIGMMVYDEVIISVVKLD